MAASEDVQPEADHDDVDPASVIVTPWHAATRESGLSGMTRRGIALLGVVMAIIGIGMVLSLLWLRGSNVDAGVALGLAQQAEPALAAGAGAGWEETIVVTELRNLFAPDAAVPAEGYGAVERDGVRVVGAAVSADGQAIVIALVRGVQDDDGGQWYCVGLLRRVGETTISRVSEDDPAASGDCDTSVASGLFAD